jgi:ADP-heptose:LPS heptosyltransferase
MHAAHWVGLASEFDGRPTGGPGADWMAIGSAPHDAPDLIFVDKAVDEMPFAPGLIALDTPRPAPGGKARVILFNAVGTGYGDAICGSVAIRALHRFFAQRGFVPEIDLVCMPHARANYDNLFKHDPHVHRVYSIGVTAEEFGAYNWAGSAEDLLADQRFADMNMIDYFLARYGLGGVEIPRVPVLFPDPAIVGAVRSAWGEKQEERWVLLNLFGSGYRRFPLWSYEALVTGLVADGWRVAMTAGPDAANVVAGFCKQYAGKPWIARVADVCPIVNRSWHHFVALAGLADAVVTPDSALLHVAAALGRPCVGVFSCIEPWYRIRHYPKCLGWTADSFTRGKYWGLHKPPETTNVCELEKDPDWNEPWRKADLGGIRRALRECAERFGDKEAA